MAFADINRRGFGIGSTPTFDNASGTCQSRMLGARVISSRTRHSAFDSELDATEPDSKFRRVSSIRKTFTSTSHMGQAVQFFAAARIDPVLITLVRDVGRDLTKIKIKTAHGTLVPTLGRFWNERAGRMFELYVALLLRHR